MIIKLDDLTSVLRLLQDESVRHTNYSKKRGDLPKGIVMLKNGGDVEGEEKIDREYNSFLRPGIVMRNSFALKLTRLDMLYSYFRIAYRHLMRGKSYTLINVMDSLLDHCLPAHHPICQF